MSSQKAHPKEMNAYWGAKQRCGYSKASNFAHYGGRGISFKYSSFEEFLKDVGPHPGGAFSLDRRNNEGHYEKGNCRWADASTQRENSRLRRDSTTGVKGVNWYAKYQKWVAVISHKKVKTFLGYFNDIEEATTARRNAERQIQLEGKV